MMSHEKASNRTLMGKCFCGAVQYAVPDEFLYAMNCHCSNCRRATGSAFKPLAGIERDKLSITQGRDGLLVYGDENRNDTCDNAFGQRSSRRYPLPTCQFDRGRGDGGLRRDVATRVGFGEGRLSTPSTA